MLLKYFCATYKVATCSRMFSLYCCCGNLVSYLKKISSLRFLLQGPQLITTLGIAYGEAIVYIADYSSTCSMYRDINVSVYLLLEWTLSLDKIVLLKSLAEKKWKLICSAPRMKSDPFAISRPQSSCNALLAYRICNIARENIVFDYL